MPLKVRIQVRKRDPASRSTAFPPQSHPKERQAGGGEEGRTAIPKERVAGTIDASKQTRLEGSFTPGVSLPLPLLLSFPLPSMISRAGRVRPQREGRREDLAELAGPTCASPLMRCLRWLEEREPKGAEP